MTLVRSAENHADLLTRVPEEWLWSASLSVGAAVASDQYFTNASVADVHMQAGHPGIRHTFFAQHEISPGVMRAGAWEVVKECDVCQSIDPAGSCEMSA